jgi:hypothetical protein
MVNAGSIWEWLDKNKTQLTLVLASWGAGLSTYNVIRDRLREAKNRKHLEFSVEPIFVAGEHQPRFNVRLSNRGKNPITVRFCCYTIKGDVTCHHVVFDYPLALPKTLNAGQEMNVDRQKRVHDKDEEVERLWIEDSDGSQWPLNRRALQKFNSQKHQIYIQIEKYWKERAEKYQEKKALERAKEK